MRRKIAFASVVLALACFPGLAFGAVVFSSNFSTSTGWSVISSSGDDIATFGYDYSTMGIPAPPGGGDTIGLHLAANTADSAGSVTAFTDLTFSGIYTVEFDAWGNYSTLGGSSEFFGGGIGHDQSTLQYPNGGSGSGGWLAMTTDGFSASDYRMYKNAGLQYPASTQYDVTTNNNTDPAFASICPPVDISSFDPPQTGQTGFTNTGVASFAWHHIKIVVNQDYLSKGVAFFYIDSLRLGVLGRAGSAFPTSGAVSLFHSDNYGSVANSFAFSVYDNLTVTDVPEPASLALLGLGGLALLRRRR